jgi:hypothetical protein
MEINSAITLLFEEDGLTIKLRDQASGITFYHGHLNSKQTLQALSRLGNTHVSNAHVYGLENIGKTLELGTLKIELPLGIEYKDRAVVAFKLAAEQCPEGWTPDNYFGSQKSFFREDDKLFAQTNIRRYV